MSQVNTGFSKFRLCCSLLSFLIVSNASAQDGKSSEDIKVADVQNEFLHAVLKKSSGDGGSMSAPISEADLEKANRKLKAAEERLLESKKTPSSVGEKPAALDKPVADPNEIVKEVKERMLASIGKDMGMAVNKDESVDKSESIAASEEKPSLALKMADEKSLTASVETEELRNKSMELERHLQEAKAKNNDLLKQLDEARNRLMLAETQVERLSSIIENRNSPKLIAKPKQFGSVHSGSAKAERPLSEKTSKVEPDMMIATVMADKVHLRSGPGKENSPIMAVTKGMRLAIETRNGDWYRVMTPNGARAWISSDVIAFGVTEPGSVDKQINPERLPKSLGMVDPAGSAELNDPF